MRTRRSFPGPGLLSAKPSVRRSTPGSATAEHSMRSSTSTRPCATQRIRPGCCRSTTAATTSIRAISATTGWATRSIYLCSSRLLGDAWTVGRDVGFPIAAPSRGRQSHAIARVQHMTPQLGRQSRLASCPRVEHERRPTSCSSSLESPGRHLCPLERGEKLSLVIEHLDRPPDATPTAEATLASTSLDEGGFLDEQRILGLQALHRKIRGVRRVDLDCIEPVAIG